jgi:hypothetical protein
VYFKNVSLKISPMDLSHFRMLGFGWEFGFGWESGFGWAFWIVEEVLDFADAFWVGWELFLLEIFAGSFLLSFLTRSQVGVLDLVR